MQNTQIPPLSNDAQAACHHMTQLIAAEIEQHGAIPFSRFMELALYAPQYGYYTGGAHKIGEAGDFITAPTLSPLFAQTLAQQICPLLPQTAGNVYEFGAGTGALAADLLRECAGNLQHYFIVELSPELAARQREHIAQTVPDLVSRVQWLPTLPDALDGIIIGNEVLDAMPVERVHHSEDGAWQRVFVSMENQQFIHTFLPLTDPELSLIHI